MHSNNPTHILCFLESDRGRDFEILLPLVIYAETYLNCRVDFAFIYDGHAIYRKRPDVVLLPNTIGSDLYYRIAKYAFENGIKVFALISEGNFRTNGTFDYWGYNRDKNFFQEYVCHWSQRTLDYLVKEEPGFAHKMVLTGGTGFDRYSIYKFKTKEAFLTPYNLGHFKKVISYAGWAFGKVSNAQGRQELIGGGHPESRFQWLIDQRDAVENMLRQAIEAHPDILFILKRHPNEANPSIIAPHNNEMVNLAHYPNVLYLYQNENIHDIIAVSDIVTGFETTTALEAWVMGKSNTVLLNPDPDFNRDEIYKGSHIVKNDRDFEACIDEFYATGAIAACHAPEILANRQKLIADTIGFSDGLNHVRAGKYLKKTLDAITVRHPKVKLNLRFLKQYILMHLGKHFYCKSLYVKLPKFKKTIWIFDNFRLKGLVTRKAEYTVYLREFYNKTDLDKI